MKVGAFDVEKGIETVEVQADEYTILGKRHLQVLLLFFLVTISSCTKLNLSVGLDAMTDSSFSENPSVSTYNWDNKRVILSSFFWGFGILQIVGAQMGRVYGIKWLLAGAMFINSIAFVLIPFVAEQFGSNGVIVCRVVQGLAQGFFYPSIQSLIGQWIPPKERLICCVFALSGNPLSSILTILLSSYVSSTSFGWPLTFYIFAVLGFLWIIPWIIFGYNCPAEHKSISEKEKMLIEDALGFTEKALLAKTPWKRIFTSPPVWAVIIAYLGQTWGNIIIQTEVPTYMVQIMKMDISSNSLMASSPHISAFVMAFVFCFLANYLILNKYVSKLFARKLFTTIGMAVPAIAVVALGLLPTDAQAWSLLLLIIAAGASSAMYSGHSANIFDLSPTFPGIIKGVSSSISHIFYIFTPFAVDIVVREETDQNYWSLIFLISTTCYISTNIFYLVFSSGKLKSWDPTCHREKKVNQEVIQEE